MDVMVKVKVGRIMTQRTGDGRRDVLTHGSMFWDQKQQKKKEEAEAEVL